MIFQARIVGSNRETLPAEAVDKHEEGVDHRQLLWTLNAALITSQPREVFH